MVRLLYVILHLSILERDASGWLHGAINHGGGAQMLGNFGLLWGLPLPPAGGQQKAAALSPATQGSPSPRPQTTTSLLNC